MAITINDFIPEIWARELNWSLRKSLVGLNTVNQDYRGEIENGGDIVHINRPEAISVGTYTPGSDITVGVPTQSQNDLAIDTFSYWAFEVDDVYETQSNISLMGPYIEEATYQLGDTIDQFLLGFYTYAVAANHLTAVTLSGTNVWTSLLVKAKKALSLKNVPLQGRWMVVSPEETAIFEQATEFQRASDLGDNTSMNGFIGRAAGFNVYESNNLTEANSRRNIYFGHAKGTTFAMQLAKTEAARRELRFSALVKGLALYGAKNIDTGAVGTLPAIVV